MKLSEELEYFFLSEAVTCPEKFRGKKHSLNIGVGLLSKVEGCGGLGGSRLTWGDKEVTMQYLELKGGDRGACKLLGDVIEVLGCLLEGWLRIEKDKEAKRSKTTRTGQRTKDKSRMKKQQKIQRISPSQTTMNSESNNNEAWTKDVKYFKDSQGTYFEDRSLKGLKLLRSEMLLCKRK
ncbi:hypothetical protein Tco_0768649 [Tanacetum coccineum]